MNDREIILRAMNSGENAATGLVLRKFLNGQEDRGTMLALMREQPAVFLTALEQGSEALGLTSRGGADIFEAVCDAVDDTKRARKLAEKHLNRARRVELLTPRGDLDSTAIGIVSLVDIFQAMLADLREATGETDDSLASGSFAAEARAELSQAFGEAELSDIEDHGGDEELEARDMSVAMSLCVRSWCYRVKDRPDFGEFLVMSMPDRKPVRAHLLYVLWLESGKPSEHRIITGSMADLFDTVGLEPVEAADELAQLVQDHKFPKISPEALAEAREEFLRHRSNKRNAPKVVEKAADELDRQAEKVDF